MTLWSLSALAGSGHGVHDFHKNITENQSCEHAKLKATKDLIENELGVYISVNNIMSCINDNCEFNSFKWIFYPALVTNLKFNTVITESDGERMCEAFVEGDVKDLKEHYQYDHDFSVIMSQSGIYHHNDYMEIEIYGRSKQFYKIFLVNKDAKMIYPNDFQDEGNDSFITVPNSLYTLRVQKEQNPNSLIVVVSSQEPFGMGKAYNFEDFTETLMYLKSEGYRLRMYNFVVK
tara:strand:+ start:3134 stop:3832 length:699 start_codon:yes stop_codon:yes gene_type:complete